MCPNILTAIKSISNFKNIDLKNYFETYPIRINAVGQRLEYYIMDAICGSFNAPKNRMAVVDRSGVFCYLGNQNNPPDMIITHGDAFEIKKIEGMGASLALNNSPPKDRLYRDDPRITQHCRNIDGGNWKSKDIFYVVGCIPKKETKLKYLFFVHGVCYAADKSVYESKAIALKANIDQFFTLQNWEMTETNELGRLNRMDPLGITNFRIRGMWEIENPINVYSYLNPINRARNFSLVAIMTNEKYGSFPPENQVALEQDSHISVQNVKIRNPNNPAQMLEAKLVTLGW